jgi:hypothetical protein
MRFCASDFQSGTGERENGEEVLSHISAPELKGRNIHTMEVMERMEK